LVIGPVELLRFGLEIAGVTAHFKRPCIFGATTRSTQDAARRCTDALEGLA
jgi:hypothetical protein